MKFIDYLKGREFWPHFTPAFAASVHNHVLDDALAGKVSGSDLLYLKAVSLAMDINPGVYDPRDHFDNGYVAESWQRLQKALARESLDGLARACHSVADLYAHSSYAHFARRDGDDLALFDGVMTDDRFDVVPDYGQGVLDLNDSARFSSNPNPDLKPPSVSQAIAYWNEHKLLSGRFAQPKDPKQSFLERLFVYIPYELTHATGFRWRTRLPHHNEIAVDCDLDSDGRIPSGHALYRDPAEYSAQFKARRGAAVKHIEQLYSTWKASGEG